MDARWTTSAWLADTVDVMDSLAGVLIGESSADELAALRELSPAGLNERLNASTIEATVAQELHLKLQELRSGPTVAELREQQGKSVHDGGLEYQFAGLDVFFNGLEGLIGLPEARALQAMELEHTAAADSLDEFTSPDYGISTTPEVEWWFVAEPERAVEWPAETRNLGAPEPSPVKRRKPLPLSEIEILRLLKNKELLELGQQMLLLEELISARMYTGPMFQKYNGCLRGLGPGFAGCKGNGYVTTIHTLNSMLVKASKLTRVGRVYRGVSGGVLPDAFWTANDHGVRGGVERAFVSTSYARTEALSYSCLRDGQPSILFEIQMGMISRGCDVSWISQYPAESECLFAPLTGFEVKRIRVEGTGLLAEVRPSVNLSALTLEQVVTKMKQSQLDLVRLIREDLTLGEESSENPPRLDLVLSQLDERDGAYFNKAENYKTSLEEVFAARHAVLHERSEKSASSREPSLFRSSSSRVMLKSSNSTRALAVDAARDGEAPTDASGLWKAAGWLASSGANEQLAQALHGNGAPPADELAATRRLADLSVAELSAHLRAGGLAERLVQTLRLKLEELLLVPTASELREQHSKFVADNTAFVFRYADLGAFFSGLEGQIGPPDERVMQAMEREHTGAADSRDAFTTNNYGITTRPEVEWCFVAQPELNVQWPAETFNLHSPEQRRKPLPLNELGRLIEQKNEELAQLNEAPLLMEEAFGARLYTGPMFQKYNDSLRGFGPTLASCKGNAYVTTIHAINSMVVKASKLTKVGCVYRGVSGGVLPDSFWTANKHGVRGGVERSFLSTTHDRAEAMRYASADDKPSVVFELQMGMIDRGCDLAWISQYKGEAECLFAPLTAFELEHTRIEGRVLVVGIRLSVNLKAQTLEQVVTKMKRAHLDLVQLFLHDLKNCSVPDRFCQPLLAHKAQQDGRVGQWYSEATNFQLATAEAFAAHDAVFDRLREHDETWAGAVRAAAMCAREGRQDVAIALLSKAKLKVEAEPDTKTRLASWIVNVQRLAPPWLETFAALGDPKLAQLIPPLLLKPDVLVPGTKVLAWDKKSSCWKEGKVERVHGDGAKFDVKAHAGSPMPDLPRSKVISISIGGVGALVRVASQTGHADLVRELIARGASVWVADEHVNLPLHGAAAAGHVDVCRELLRGGADETVVNGAGQSAVLLARGNGRRAVNRLFVRAFSDGEFTEEACAGASAGGPITPLMVACRMRDLAQVDEALSQGGDVNAQSAAGCTALYLAAEEGDDRIVGRLIAHGANVAIAANDGSTPLLRACEFYVEGCVQLLLGAGAQVNQSSLSGLTPLIAASQHGHTQCVHTLIEAGAGLELADETGWTALLHACASGHDHCVMELLEAGATPEAAAVDGLTPLMLACRHGHVWIIRRLIEAKASLDKKNTAQSTTALMEACASGQLDSVNVLLQAGANIEVEEAEGWTALVYACRFKQEECAKALIMAGCSINHRAHTGRTVLMAASHRGSDRCVYGLLLSGAEINAADLRGWTSLMFACDNGHTSIVASLINAKVDLDAQASNGDTALIIASNKGHDGCVRALVDAGANVLAANRDGVAALSAARKKGHDSKCRAIIEAAAAEGKKKKKSAPGRCEVM